MKSIALLFCALSCLGQSLPPFPSVTIHGGVVRTNRVQYDRPVELEWSPSPSPNVSGYNIYYGTNASRYNAEIVVGNVTNVTVTNLFRGLQYFFSATAVGSNGLESARCPQTSFTGFRSTLWMFVFLNDEQIYSEIPVGIEYFRTNSVDTMETPDFQNWYYLCPAGKILFSNVTTVIQ